MEKVLEEHYNNVFKNKDKHKNKLKVKMIEYFKQSFLNEIENNYFETIDKIDTFLKSVSYNTYAKLEFSNTRINISFYENNPYKCYIYFNNVSIELDTTECVDINDIINFIKDNKNNINCEQLLNRYLYNYCVDGNRVFNRFSSKKDVEINKENVIKACKEVISNTYDVDILKGYMDSKSCINYNILLSMNDFRITLSKVKETTNPIKLHFRNIVLDIERIDVHDIMIFLSNQIDFVTIGNINNVLLKYIDD